MKKKLGYIPVVLILIIAVAGFYMWKGTARDEPGDVPSAGEETKVRVSVTTGVPVAFEDKVSFVGTIESEEDIRVSSRVTSSVQVLKIHVHVGDVVEKGQLLAELDEALVERQMEEVRASVSEAREATGQARSRFQTTERDYERYRNLFAEDVISRQEMDQMEGRYVQEKAGLEQARQRLVQSEARLRQMQTTKGYYRITSPAEGIVAERYFEPGDTVKYGEALFVLSRQERVKIKGPVTEKAYPKIRVGQEAAVRVDAFPESSFEATVTRISPVLDSRSRTADLEVLLPSEGMLRPGMFARVDVSVGTHEGLAIPREAIRQLPGTGEWHCFVVSEEGTARQRPVKRGAESGNMVEIVDGLDEKDLVIAPLVRAIEDGVPVEVVGQ
ncbi:MAG TPA: efflux RND transporter periplasmic adaptor subunit [Synergistales bacterium]|jgi:RND family efflux transporter MFP subunit|nr:efflux RND transporter periplasmic adaptor subunit [Synergistales bacterium]HQO83065.1 efflux RND transporter periplasmic adaptor subunit [Synergistales bacterium]HQQ10616.1 efflux RND transporter periplasmic adaptor subunit [Synergistales bacterium]